jgi:hypothetical protein
MVEGGLLICMLRAGSHIQIQRGNPCSTLTYQEGLWRSCQHIICPNMVLMTTITGPTRAQIFPCDSDMKLKQPVPIWSAIFRPWLGGGVYQKSFAKTYLLAKCFTIICRVCELRKTSERVTRLSMEQVCPDRAIQLKRTSLKESDSDQDKHGTSLPRQSNSSSLFDNEVRVTTL